MKYLYTFFALFLILGLNAQTTLTFSEAGLTASACDGNIKGDSGVTATIGDDAGNKYLSANSGATDAGEAWKNAQIRLTNQLGDGYKFTNYLVAGAGSSISFKIWTEDLSGIAKNDAGDPFTGMLKLEKGQNGAGNVEYSFNISDTGGWQDITIDLGTQKDGTSAVAAGSEYGLIVFFNNYGNGSTHNAGLRYYDDITFENGAAIPDADASLVPPSAAPTPTHGSLNTDKNADAADVFNIFSDHYAGSLIWCPDNEARAGWSAGGSTTPYDLAGDGSDAIVMQEKLEFIGSYWNGGGTNKLGSIDISNYANVNIDIYFQELTGTDHELGIALLTPDEKLVKYPIAAGAAGWQTITLDLSEYGTRLDEVNGIKIEGLTPAGDGAVRWTPSISWDNLFAWNPPSANSVVSFAINAKNAGALFDATGGEVLAISYSTDGGNNYTISNPLDDTDADGIWTGSITVAKDGSTVQYKVVTTDVTSGYATANDSSGDALASDADFSFTAATNTVAQDLFILDRDTGAFATTVASAKVDVTIQITGLYPGETTGQYGITTPTGANYALGAANDDGNGTAGDGILAGKVKVPFYSTLEYRLHFNNPTFGWDGMAETTLDAATNAVFSVTVVESDVTEELSATAAEDANGNFVTYTATLSFDDISVELTIYPNPADQFIAVKSSEILSGLRVIDMTGKEVIRKSVQSNDYSLDLGNLNTGIYFLEATSEGASKTMRFIKK